MSRLCFYICNNLMFVPLYSRRDWLIVCCLFLDSEGFSECCFIIITIFLKGNTGCCFSRHTQTIKTRFVFFSPRSLFAWLSCQRHLVFPLAWSHLTALVFQVYSSIALLTLLCSLWRPTCRHDINVSLSSVPPVLEDWRPIPNSDHFLRTPLFLCQVLSEPVEKDFRKTDN